MNGWRRFAALVAGAVIAGACATAPSTRSPRQAVEQSLPLLQHTMDQWFEERTCTSCHHQSLGTMALAFARERGFRIDEERFQRQVERLGNSPEGTLAALQGQAAINPASGRGFQLAALAAADHPADERTDAMVHAIAGLCSDSGAFWSQSHRPPLEDSPVTSTALCCRAMSMYGPAGRRAEFTAKTQRSRDWLAAYRATTNEERTMRLLGLHWAGAERAAVEAAAAELLRMQRDDGGFAQLDGDASDAYATGQALVALQQVGGLTIDATAYQRGVRYLLDTQWTDGSWLVQTRRRAPGLEHFETGFPHGEHQFVSCAATAWAAMALAAAVDARPSVLFHGERPTRATGAVAPQLPPLHTIAAFGSAADLRRALDAGGDGSAPGPGGVSPLMLAVHDPQKVALLLTRGVPVDVRSELGSTALILAAGAGPLAVVDLLLAAGADPTARDDEGVSPLVQAVVAGDRSKVRRLLAAGGSARDSAKEGFTLLHLACWQGDTAMAALLLDAGADANARFGGMTPLLAASADGSTEIVEVLLRGGAEVDATDEEGMTALAWAARTRWGHGRIAAALLAAGANPDRPAKNGRTPRDQARLEKNVQVQTVLR